MIYSVAIKLDQYSAQFEFSSYGERQDFIEVTKRNHPDVEIVLSEYPCTKEKQIAA